MATQKIVTDPRRQASDSIRGYVYQIYQSVFAWITLKNLQALVLEGAEDFDVYENDNVEISQVKDTRLSGPITLRTKSVVAAINHFSECQKSNPEYEIRLRYLTTSERALEKGAPFGEGIRGLDYWEQCRTEDGDIQRLVDFLLTLELSNDLKDFLKNTDPELARNRLIRRIFWDTGRKASEALVNAIDSQLAYNGHKLGIPPSDSIKVRSKLVEEVCRIITEKQDKILNFKDYLDIFEKFTGRWESRANINFLQQVAQQAISYSSLSLTRSVPTTPPLTLSDSMSEFLSPPQLIQGACNREIITADLEKVLKREKLLILYGSTGTGKSILAILLTRRIKGDLYWLHLRGVDPRQVNLLLYEVGCRLDHRDVPPFLVIDDLNLSRYFVQYEAALQALLFKVFSAGGKVIITSQGAAPAQLFIKLWLNAECERRVPNFTIEEIKELLMLNGCIDENLALAWGQMIWVTTSGHPQLAHARVRYLRFRNWPKPSAEDSLKMPDVEQERENARQRLIGELPYEDARNLIYRLTVLTGYFRRETAIALGDIPPAINLPGEAFDLLAGPWIERYSEYHFRISPLLEGAAKSIWSQEKLREFQRAAADALIKKKHLTPGEANNILLLGLASKSEPALVASAHAVLKAPSNIQPFLAKEMFWLAFIALKPGEQIYPSNPQINLMLRAVQFWVASNQEDKHSAIPPGKAWLHDLDAAKNQEGWEYHAFMFNLKILISCEIPFPLKFIIERFAQLIFLYERLGNKVDLFPKGLELELPGVKMESDFVGNLTQIQTMRIHSSKDLDEMFSALGTQLPEIRDRILEVYKNNEIGAALAELLFSGGWLSEVKKENPDFEFMITIFERAARFGVEWSCNAFVTSGFEVIAVLQDEYLNAPERALEALGRAVDLIGKTNNHLEYQRAKVFFGQKRYKECLEILKGIIHVWKANVFNINPMFASRLAGISAAKLDKWKEAAQLFQLGAEYAEKLNLPVPRVGFLADEAFAYWKAGDKLNGLKVMIEVLDKLALLPEPNLNLQCYTLHKRIGHAIAWMNKKALKDNLENSLEPAPGWMSSSDVDERIKELPLQPEIFLFSLLADIESELNVTLGIFERLEKEKEKVRLPFLNLRADFLRLERFFKSLDLENIVPNYIKLRASNYVASQLRERGQGVFDSGDEIRVPEDILSGEAAKVGTIELILLALITLIARRGWKDIPIEKWKKDCLDAGLLDSSVNDFLSMVAHGDSFSVLDLTSILQDQGVPPGQWFLSAILVSINDFATAELLFQVNLQLTIFIGKLDWKNFVAQDFESLVTQKWLNIVTNQRFALRSPQFFAPKIETECRGAETGLKKVARVLLATHGALNVKISEESLEQLKKLAER